jgi:hypothetical protein
MSYYSEQNPYYPQDRFAPGMPAMPPPGFPPATPTVWYFYIVYCVLMALLYLLCLGGGLAMIAFADEIAAQDPTSSPTEGLIIGSVLAVMGGGLLLMYGIAPLLPKSKGAWIYGFVTIGLGMTSACTLPFCIGLLIFWLRPETKAFFRAA